MVICCLVEEQRSGFVGVLGRSNVGKSTLVNRILGHKVLPVSPKPQTTRRRQLGILTDGNIQVIFVDTPGIHKPVDRLGIYLNEVARRAMKGVDVILFIADASQPPREEDTMVAEFLSSLEKVPTILALNKIDLVPEALVHERERAYVALLARAESIPISALTGHGLTELVEKLKSMMPARPFHYPEDLVTDLAEREIAAELIREAILFHVHEEIPYACAVRIEAYEERDERTAYILATIFVEKESQKPILIGKGGTMIKTVGTRARKEIEALTGRKVYLELRVKVLKRWRNREAYLKMLLKG
jgi:GTP-binding protein Era